MNINDISKELTRKEFMENIYNDVNNDFEYKNQTYDCPNKLGLKDHCYSDSCKECWLKSIKVIKFKGEYEMNKKEELEQQIKSKQEELLRLKGELENIEDTNFEYDTEVNGWYIDEFGKIQTNEYFSDDIAKNYNYFANEEYAAKIAVKQRFERKLLAYKDRNGDKCDWHDDDYKYYAYLNLGEDKVETNVCRNIKCSDICFHSENLLLKHIEENNQEWINYFNICKELD